jgi:uncharacterized membrane protein
LIDIFGKDRYAPMLAGLCYLPIPVINIIVPFYVIMARKGGHYAAFHAKQSLLLGAVLIVLNLVVSAAFVLIFLQMFAPAPIAAQDGAAGPEAFFSILPFMEAMAPPLAAFQALAAVFCIFLGYKAYVKQGISIPVIADFCGKEIAGKDGADDKA